MKREKQRIREYVWNLLMEKGVARFPLPPHGRIPNFLGSDEAGLKLVSLDVFEEAGVVKVNPDSPQRIVREYALRMGKKLLMPTPRIKKGFLLLDGKVLRGRERFASTIKGAFRLGRIVRLSELPRVDLIVEGSVAVGLDCSRLGKGEGYAELEYAILRELGLVDEYTPIATTVHELQIFDTLPQDPFDVPVDIVVTPKRIIRPTCRKLKPVGIYWEYITNKKMDEIPILKELRNGHL